MPNPEPGRLVGELDDAFDREIEAMRAIIEALKPLDKETAGRVLEWVSDRLGL